MPVVTLSREYGAGGLVVGRRVAERLGIDFLDAALISEVSRRLRVSEEAVQRWDERREGIILRLLKSMQASHPDYAPLPPMPQEMAGVPPDSDAVMRVTSEVIEEAARTNRAVIVGRGGVVLLAGRPEVVHVRLVAPRPFRIRRMAVLAGTDEAAAAKEVESADRERTAYLKHHFGNDCQDPRLFALVINTEEVPLEMAADLIVDLIRSRESQA